MKKCFIMVLVIACLVINSLGVLAATTFTDNEDGTIDVVYDAGVANAGKQYTIAVFKGQNSMKAEDILYINQTSANENGLVVFESCGLLDYVNATVYVGGETLGDPLPVGVVLGKSQTLMGDVNSDKTINITDVTILTQYVAGWGVSGIDLDACDVTGDGSVNATDVTVLMQRIAGWNV